MLFKPDLIGEECEGIHQILTFSIQKSDMDLRRTLFSNIVLSGGSTLFKGKKHMSHLMRKPTICICENKDADQRLCFCYINPKFQAASLLL